MEKTDNLNIYFVVNKSDDYGNCRIELVETTPKNAKQYYYWKEVDKGDIDTLKKYLEFIDYEEEKGRDSEQRFY